MLIYICIYSNEWRAAVAIAPRPTRTLTAPPRLHACPRYRCTRATRTRAATARLRECVKRVCQSGFKRRRAGKCRPLPITLRAAGGGHAHDAARTNPRRDARMPHTHTNTRAHGTAHRAPHKHPCARPKRRTEHHTNTRAHGTAHRTQNAGDRSENCKSLSPDTCRCAARLQRLSRPLKCPRVLGPITHATATRLCIPPSVR